MSRLFGRGLDIIRISSLGNSFLKGFSTCRGWSVAFSSTFLVRLHSCRNVEKKHKTNLEMSRKTREKEHFQLFLANSDGERTLVAGSVLGRT